jgi:hypothetical protein
MGKFRATVPRRLFAPVIQFGQIYTQVTAPGRRSFTWAPPSGRVFRAVAAVCLVALVVSCSCLAWVLLRDWDPAPQHQPVQYVAVGFLAVIFVGTGYVLATHLLPSRPERVLLDGDTFAHDSGWVSPAVFFRLASVPRPLHWNSRRLWGRSVRLSRQDMGPVATGFLEGQHRLWYHRGEEVIEIGAFLSDFEREWLADCIAEWQEEGEACPASS